MHKKDIIVTVDNRPTVEDWAEFDAKLPAHERFGRKWPHANLTLPRRPDGRSGAAVVAGGTGAAVGSFDSFNND